MINAIKNKYVQYSLFGAFLVFVISMYIWNVSRLPTKLEFYVFDTKGNPSIFIRTPYDTRILINSGANSEVIRELTSILPFYSKRIDEVIVTSDSSDDVTGLIDVVNRYKVSRVILPKFTAKESGFSSSTDKIYETFLDAINRLKIPIKKFGRGDILNINENNPSASSELKAEILFPEALDKFKYSKASSPEMVLKFDYGYTSFMLIGNTSLKIQKFIASLSAASSSSINIKSNVLIVPHNVSTSSLSTNLINAVKPEFVIYSQAVSNSKSSVNSKSSLNKTDPLYMIMADHRFNLKQKSTILVLSDGKSMEIK